ncbi:MAG: HlyD family efflux transporter periplasmic adaptor subunit, partial [Gammaproteobacteria bacterium]
SGRISLPALLETAEHTTVYAPAPGRIATVEVRPGQQVEAGDVLIVLESPEIDNQLEQTRRRLQVLELRASRHAADLVERANMHVVLESWKTEAAKIAGLEALEQRMVIRAPVSGRISSTDDELHRGRWINQQLAIARIVQPQAIQITALSPETRVKWIEPGLEARFYPDDALRPSIGASVAEVSAADVDTFDLPYLASTYGGEIAVRRDTEGKLVAEKSVYRIRLIPLDMNRTAPGQAVRGVVHVSGRARSFAERVGESVAAVLIRESGF